MKSRILALYPPGSEPVEVQGLYLGLRLHRLGTVQRPMVFANFLSSLDGRIALPDSGGPSSHVPKEMTTANDFRLLQELEAQTDCIVTHGGYLRALAEGRLGNILEIGRRSDSHDLAQWREGEGLPAQPLIVVASASLDFTLPEFLLAGRQPCCIATGALADQRRIAAWKEKGVQVIIAGEGRGVEGRALIEALSAFGCRCMYLSAGPWMLETMLRDGQLSKVFHTTTHQLVGGVGPITMLGGERLGCLGNLTLRSLYYDASSPPESGQFFAHYDVNRALGDRA